MSLLPNNKVLGPVGGGGGVGAVASCGMLLATPFKRWTVSWPHGITLVCNTITATSAACGRLLRAHGHGLSAGGSGWTVHSTIMMARGRMVGEL